jgi:hypothetical protein
MMKSKFVIVLIIGIIVATAPFTKAQQRSEIDQLRAEIQKLEVVEHDSTTTSEVRALNARFLGQRRARLQKLLTEELAALRRYQATAGSMLTNEERSAVENSIASFKRELDSLNASVTNPPNFTSDGVSTSVSPTSANGDNHTNGSTDPPPATSLVANPAAGANAAPNPTAAAVSPPQAAAPVDCSLFANRPKTFSMVDRYICNLAKSVKDAKLRDPNNNNAPNAAAGLDLDAAFTRLVIVLVAKKGRSDEMVKAEEARVDKQVGGSSGNSGSTSLVVKGNVPAILGFAVENGALTKETSGTTITFRGNPVGIGKALAGKGIIGGFDTDDATARFLRRFSFGFSFDTDRGTTPGTFTGTKQQLSEVTARVVLYDKRDPRRGEYKKDWEDFLANQAQAFLNADAETRDAYLDTSTPVTRWKDPAMTAWFVATQAALAKASLDQVETVLINELNKLPIDKLSPDFNSQLAKFEQKFSLLLRSRNKILEQVGQAGVLTFDYVNERNANKPDLSHFRFIGEKGFNNGRFDLTGNGSFSVFNSRPTAGLGRFSDAQAALQLDGTFGDPEKTGVFVLSFAYKYQHLLENAMTQAGTIVPDTKGDINVGQVKLTVPIKGLGMKLPISFTFANRTELIKEKEVRGNFGFTFDLDTIFAKFKPF